MPLFSASRGMKRPETEKMSNREAMKRVGESRLVYRESFLIGGDDKTGNIVDKRYYKRKK